MDQKTFKPFEFKQKKENKISTRTAEEILQEAEDIAKKLSSKGG